jgi:hypothetical protein
MLSVRQQVAQDRDLRIVRRADERAVVAVKRNLANVAEIGFGRDGVDNASSVRAGHAQALLPLNAVSNNEDAHDRPVFLD